MRDDEDLPELWALTQDDDGNSEVLETPPEVWDSTQDYDGDSEVPETPASQPSPAAKRRLQMDMMHCAITFI